MPETLSFAPAEPDSRCRSLVWVVPCGVAAACVFAVALSCLGSGVWPFALAALVASALVITTPLVIFRAYVPVAYQIGDDAVIIQRKWARPVVLPLAALRDARAVGRAWFMLLCANPGILVVCGLCWNRSLGCFYVSARNMDRLVALEGETIRSWVISPAEVDEFVEEVNSRIGRAG